MASLSGTSAIEARIAASATSRTLFVRVLELESIEFEVLDVPAHEVAQVDEVLVAGQHQLFRIALGDRIALDRCDIGDLHVLDWPVQRHRHAGANGAAVLAEGRDDALFLGADHVRVVVTPSHSTTSPPRISGNQLLPSGRSGMRGKPPPPPPPGPRGRRRPGPPPNRSSMLAERRGGGLPAARGCADRRAAENRGHRVRGGHPVLRHPRRRLRRSHLFRERHRRNYFRPIRRSPMGCVVRPLPGHRALSHLRKLSCASYRNASGTKTVPRCRFSMLGASRTRLKEETPVSSPDDDALKQALPPLAQRAAAIVATRGRSRDRGTRCHRNGRAGTRPA